MLSLISPADLKLFLYVLIHFGIYFICKSDLLVEFINNILGKYNLVLNCLFIIL